MDVLRLVLPDWHRIDDVFESKLPFVLWRVGEQPLLYHWLDYAVNNDVRRVVMECSDRPAEVRQAMEKARLWPLEWELRPVPESQVRSGVHVVDTLPGRPSPPHAPTNGWELIDLWFQLQRAWFDETVAADEAWASLALGRFAQIHPSAEIQMPVWFDDQVQIGPNCKVGPYAVLGRGVVLEGPSVVENAVITEHTFLAGHTELRDAVLDGGVLLNLRHRARIPKLDNLMADRIRGPTDRPTMRERMLAGALYAAGLPLDLLAEAPTRAFETFDGLQLEERATGSLWRRRLRWLPEVVKGRMRLWGPLPRTRDQLAALDPEWRAALEHVQSGVFAYSDLHGTHRADTDMEPIHAVFQASSPRDAMNVIFKENILQLLRVTEQSPADDT